MNVLSLFGGAEQGRAVLQEMGITPTNYFSSEIDPYAIKLSSDNFPDIVHIGGVTDVYYKQKTGGLYWDGDSKFVGEVDFLIGGPPCQDLSIAGKRAGLDGARSSLFYEYVRILNETKPKIFFMENVASMPKEARDTITKTLFGIEPIRIDSRLTSCQTRKRLYWFGVRQPDGTYKGIDIPQPEDAGILLKDILEDIPFDALDKKGEPIWKPVPEKYIGIIQERIEKGNMGLFNINPSGKGMNGNVLNTEGKLGTLTTNKGEGQKICVRIPEATKKGFVELQEGDCVDMAQPNSATPRGRMMRDKMNGITTSPQFYTLGQFRRGSSLRIHSEQDKVCTLTANMRTGGNNVPIIIASQFYWRKLTVRECARAQSFPESYSFDSVSASRGYKACGNSWEGKAVRHMWEYLLKNL